MAFILKAAAGGLASVGFKKLQVAFEGDAVGDIKNQLNDISYQLSSTEQRITNEIKKAVYGAAYSAKITTLNGLVDELNRVVPYGKDNAEYQKHAMKVHNERLSEAGVESALNHIHDLLVGNVASSEGLLKTWPNSMHESLQSDNYSYDISWYLDSIDQHLCAAAIVQLRGLMLLTFGAISEPDAAARARYIQYHIDRVTSRITYQTVVAYQNMHPAIRSIKPDYFTPIDYDNWYILRAEDQRVLSVRQVAYDPVSLESPNGMESVWRFAPSSSSGKRLVINGRTRVPIHGVWWDNYDAIARTAKQTMRCTNANFDMSGGDKFMGMELVQNDPMPLKLTPCANSHRFRLARPDGFAAGRSHWFWDQKYELSRDGVIQFDQPAPPGNDHYYTIESDSDGAFRIGYKYEGLCGWVYRNQVPGSVPFWRFRHKASGDHLYTSSQSEYNAVNSSSDWAYEKTACYLPTAASGQTVAIRRWYGTKNGQDHMYTISPAEGDNLRADGWADEGDAGLAFSVALPGTTPFYRWSRR